MASGYFDERDADKPASAKHPVLNNGHIARAQALLNRISYLQNEEAKLDRDIEGTRKKTEALLSRKVECSRDQDVARAANDVLLALKSDRPSTGSGPLPSLPKAAAPVVAPGCLPGDPDCSEAAAAQPASDTLPLAPAVGVPAVTAPPSASPHQPAPLPAPQPAAGAGAAVLAAARPPPRTHRKCGQAAAPTPASAPDLHAASTCGPVPQPSCVQVSQGAERAAALPPAADSPGTRAPALLQPHGHLTLLRATTGPTVGLAAAATQAIRDSAPAPQLGALPGDSPPHPPSPATPAKVQAADSGKSRQHHSGQAVSGQSLPGQLGAKSGSREGAGRHQKQPARSATKDSQAAGDSGRPRCPTPGGSCAAAGPAGLTLVTGAGGATQAAAAGASAVGAHGRGGRADLQTNSTNRMTALASERGQHLELDPDVIEELVTQPGPPSHPSAATACCQRESAPGITAFAAAEGLQHFATQPLAPRKLVTTLSASRTASSLGCVPCLGRGVPGAAAGTGLPLPLPSLPPPYPHNSAAANKAPGAAAQPSTTSSSSSTAPKQGVPTCSPGWSLSAAAEASGAAGVGGLGSEGKGEGGAEGGLGPGHAVLAGGVGWGMGRKAAPLAHPPSTPRALSVEAGGSGGGGGGGGNRGEPGQTGQGPGLRSLSCDDTGCGASSSTSSHAHASSGAAPCRPLSSSRPLSSQCYAAPVCTSLQQQWQQWQQWWQHRHQPQQWQQECAQQRQQCKQQEQQGQWRQQTKAWG
ncbi:hypothetical protein QJQ45_012908 [Haematococcus lacustris]|nr:hypothetical protein QJQ45_012908 [Haematococcus lacustris]